MEPKANKPIKKRTNQLQRESIKLTDEVPKYVVNEDGKVFIKYDAISIDMAPLGYVVAVFIWKGESVFTIGPFNLTPGTALNLTSLEGRAEISLQKD